MSADNWTICPECLKNRTDLVKAARDLYGRVSKGDYEQAMEDARNVAPQEETLREDYGFSLEGSSLSIYYGCMCQDCGFTFNFNEEIDIKP